jgi:hypothetical protein
VMLLLFGMLGYFSIQRVKCPGTLLQERALMP